MLEARISELVHISIQVYIFLRRELADELEALLYRKDQGLYHNSESPPQFDSWSQSLNRQTHGIQELTSSLSQTHVDINKPTDAATFSIFPPAAQNSDPAPSLSGINETLFDNQVRPTFDSLPGATSTVNQQAFSFITPPENATIEEPALEVDMNWPPHLPPPPLLRHLCVSAPCSRSYI
jgi:hypothetical protein